ncbi:MAG: hypothetical protein OXH06_18595, partial [Gemmatimonadetes bacterium]|nr:hypothetical protein [Gemmatimonadota bacterium]
MRWSILILLLLITPVWAATEHYYVNEEEEAHPFRDGTGTYGNPVELDEILVEDVERDIVKCCGWRGAHPDGLGG